MSDESKQLGRSGEERAAEFLMARGYTILARNCRTRFGEIDIIARDGKAAVFVEVKARSSQSFGTAREAVNRKKQAKLALIIRDFVAAQNYMGPVRCEVVAIDGRGEPELVSEMDFTDID